MRISKIQVEECGPLKKKTWPHLATKNLILIYGKNESGKSYLADLIISCLFKFRKKGSWGYIRDQVNGKISLIDCPGGRSHQEFTPRTRKKLEDCFLEYSSGGLPPELVKLLVVRAGEVEIIRDEYGLSVEFLKNLFSQKRILNSIEGKIPESVKKATLLEHHGLIDIAQQTNEARNYHLLKEDLRRLEDLREEVLEQYELGELKSLQEIKKELEEKKMQLELARRHRAFLLSREIDKLERRLQEFPTEDEINETKRKIENFKQKTREMVKLGEQIRELEVKLEVREKVEWELNLQEKARRYLAFLLTRERNGKLEELGDLEGKTRRLEDLHSRYVERANLVSQRERELKNREKVVEEYLWLKAAKEHYLKLREGVGRPLISLRLALFAPLFFALAGVVLLLLKKADLSLYAFVLTLLGLIWVIVQTFRSKTDQASERELQALKSQYQNRYGQELRTFADLEAREKSLEGEFHEIEAFKRQMDEWNRELNNLLVEVKTILSEDVTSVDITEEDLRGFIDENRRKISLLKQEGEEINIRLARLDVPEKDLEFKHPGVEFDQEKFERLRVELDRLSQAEKVKNEYTSLREELEIQLDDSDREIHAWFARFGENVERELWEEELRKMEKERNKLETELHVRKGELIGLGVPERGYIAEDPGVDYSPDKVKEVEDKLGIVSRDLAKLDDTLKGFRQKIASFTGCDISASWNVLLDALFRKIGELRGQLKKVEAFLIARILLASTIKDLDKEEEEKIEALLQARDVNEMIYRLTRRYKRIFQEAPEGRGEGLLFVSDGISDFKLADLSTGAREQVLLALRIAFIKKLLRNKSCFLFLDDAFQHTDYERRPSVVESLKDLAESGWQIFYLTMDDHIRDLFQHAGALLGERYEYIHL